MESLTTITSPRLTAYLRKDFYADFAYKLKDLLKDSNCHYFSHNIIKNYGQADSEISTFNLHEDWQETYWQKYKDNDPLEKITHHAAVNQGLGMSSWNIIDPNSECAEVKSTMCDVRDGLMFAKTYPTGRLENMSFGWKSLDGIVMDLDRMFSLIKMTRFLREHHRENLPFQA